MRLQNRHTLACVRLRRVKNGILTYGGSVAALHRIRKVASPGKRAAGNLVVAAIIASKRHLMTPSPSPQITELLRAWSAGDQTAVGQIVELVYPELHKIARTHLYHERPGHTIQATALVNGAYLRLVNIRHVHWQDRAHFLAIGARVMRRILVDYARKRPRGTRVDLVEDRWWHPNWTWTWCSWIGLLKRWPDLTHVKLRSSKCDSSEASPPKRSPRFLPFRHKAYTGTGAWRRLG